MALSEDDKVEQLIIEVENNEILYNMADKEYKDTRKKYDVWEEIANKVGIATGQIAARKFVNIKDAYVAYLRKVGQSRSGQGLGGKVRKYNWADQLQFLNAFVTTRRSTGNLTEVTECESLLNNIAECSVVVSDEPDTAMVPPEETQKELNIPLPSPMATNRKRAKNEDVNAVIIDYLWSKKSDKVKEVKEMDALGHFFESTLKTVRKFPKSKQVELKKS